jgi:hypothetical protein
MLQRAELTVSAEVDFSEPSSLSMPMARTHRATTALATLVLRVTQTDKLVGNLLPSAASLSQLVSLSKRENSHSELSLDLEGGRTSTMELIYHRLTSGITTLQTLTTQGLVKLNANNCANKPRPASHMVGKLIFVG